MSETASLFSIQHIPTGARDGSPLVVLLHGRGADEQNLQSLSAFLPDDTLLVTPRGPFPAAPWGYGPGWAWYRYVGEDRVEDDRLGESLEHLDHFLAELDAQLPVRIGPRFLGGFSQGGTTSLAWGLSRTEPLAGIINFGGFLVNSPLVPLPPSDPERTEVFWGHGESDQAIPFPLATRGRNRLVEAGVRLETFDHPGGHTITAEEIRSFREWFDARRAAVRES